MKGGVAHLRRADRRYGWVVATRRGWRQAADKDIGYQLSIAYDMVNVVKGSITKPELEEWASEQRARRNLALKRSSGDSGRFTECSICRGMDCARLQKEALLRGLVVRESGNLLFAFGQRGRLLWRTIPQEFLRRKERSFRAAPCRLPLLATPCVETIVG